MVAVMIIIENMQEVLSDCNVMWKNKQCHEVVVVCMVYSDRFVVVIGAV